MLTKNMDMKEEISKTRATMPHGTAPLLDTRSLHRSNANLLHVLRPGQHVLDVGCGTGTITIGICDLVGNDGRVVGVDRSEELIRQAIIHQQDRVNLSFICGDILEFQSTSSFDVITAARTIQWLSNPAKYLAIMKSLLKPGGALCILDFDHEAIEWKPDPPPSMINFYKAFLQWRADAGIDNRIGTHAATELQRIDMKIIFEQDFSEYAEKGEEGFGAHINLWSIVAETRGKQMVNDNYLSEESRVTALNEYGQWCASEAKSMKLVLRATHATY
jgi:ubiquinone/menaquinone biosynthesis C-methylase UbiE